MPIPAGVALAGSLLPAVGSFLGGSQANATNRRIAREQMAFQERMSSTSYQRAVHDMRMAGINPMLAYMQGGASSPGGASTTVSDVVGPAIASAQHGRRLQQELMLMREQSDSVRAQTGKTDAENFFLQQYGPMEAKARSAAHMASAENSRANTLATLALMPSRQLGGQLSRGLLPFVSMAGEGFGRIQNVLGATQRFADNVREGIFDTGRRVFDRLRPNRRNDDRR